MPANQRGRKKCVDDRMGKSSRKENKKNVLQKQQFFDKAKLIGEKDKKERSVA